MDMLLLGASIGLGVMAAHLLINVLLLRGVPALEGLSQLVRMGQITPAAIRTLFTGSQKQQK